MQAGLNPTCLFFNSTGLLERHHSLTTVPAWVNQVFQHRLSMKHIATPAVVIWQRSLIETVHSLFCRRPVRVSLGVAMPLRCKLLGAVAIHSLQGKLHVTSGHQELACCCKAGVGPACTVSYAGLGKQKCSKNCKHLLQAQGSRFSHLRQQISALCLGLPSQARSQSAHGSKVWATPAGPSWLELPWCASAAGRTPSHSQTPPASPPP